jgi:hypothetical protein
MACSPNLSNHRKGRRQTFSPGESRTRWCFEGCGRRRIDTLSAAREIRWTVHITTEPAKSTANPNRIHGVFTSTRLSAGAQYVRAAGTLIRGSSSPTRGTGRRADTHDEVVAPGTRRTLRTTDRSPRTPPSRPSHRSSTVYHHGTQPARTALIPTAHRDRSTGWRRRSFPRRPRERAGDG